jgi:N6-adenosine-specific RNA methylase IME4
MEIKINEEFKKLIPPLTDEEYNQLEENIKNYGWRDDSAIILWNNTIIDGHHRYKICSENNIKFKTIFMNFDNENEVKLWMINEQKGRRNLTDGWKWELAQTKKELLLEKGRGNMSEGGKEGLSIVDKPLHNTQLEMAKETGWSSGKVATADVVWKKADEETKSKIKDGELTFNQVYTEIKKEEKKEERINKIKQQREKLEKGLEEPEGDFDVLVIDPPWRYHDDNVYDSEGFRGVTDYPTMSVEEIKAIELPAKENCVLWLWTTHRFMRHSFTLLDTWGFEEKAILTWCKNKMGIGRWLRSKSEFCIMAVKGKPTINLTNQTTILNADATKHSEKPDVFYEMVEKLCVGRRLDYFARKKREGWAVFGDEVPKNETKRN